MRIFSSVGAIAGLLVAGCAQVPTPSMWALRNFDPLNADATRLRAAVAAPVALTPKSGGVTLVIEQARKDGSDKRSLKVVLEEVPASADGPDRAPRVKAGMAAHVFRVPPKEVAALDAVRAEIRERMAHEPGKWSGSVTVSAAGCFTGAELPAGPIMIDTYLKTETTPDFVPLVEGFDLRSHLDEKALADAVPGCKA